MADYYTARSGQQTGNTVSIDSVGGFSLLGRHDLTQGGDHGQLGKVESWGTGRAQDLVLLAGGVRSFHISRYQ
jgi:hypothetical protein